MGGCGQIDRDDAGIMRVNKAPRDSDSTVHHNGQSCFLSAARETFMIDPIAFRYSKKITGTLRRENASPRVRNLKTDQKKLAAGPENKPIP